MHQRERKLTTILSGLALCLAMVAASAASDQSRELDFEKDKKLYIKQYALPKAPGPLQTEVLFTKRAAQNRTTVTPELNKSNLSQPPPPAATEPSHE